MANQTTILSWARAMQLGLSCFIVSLAPLSAQTGLPKYYGYHSEIEWYHFLHDSFPVWKKQVEESNFESPSFELLVKIASIYNTSIFYSDEIYFCKCLGIKKQEDWNSLRDFENKLFVKANSYYFQGYRYIRDTVNNRAIMPFYRVTFYERKQAKIAKAMAKIEELETKASDLFWEHKPKKSMAVTRKKKRLAARLDLWRDNYLLDIKHWNRKPPKRE